MSESPPKSEPTLSILIPTVGRSSLSRTLESVRTQRLIPGDEVLLAVDGGDDSAHSAWAASGLPGRIVKVAGGPHRDWGCTARNLVIPMASADYVCFIDDDDVYLPGAFDKIRSALAVNPDRPHLFRMGWRDKIIWEERVVREANFSTQQIVVPNVSTRLGRWTSRYEGDYDFLVSTLALWPEGSLVWASDVIARCNDVATHHPQTTIKTTPTSGRSADLVVSRYAADTSWIERLLPKCGRVFVYDKSSDSVDWQRGLAPNVEKPIIHRRLPNTGKCDHTYLHHIVSRWDDLADWTLFSPDFPFDHLCGCGIGELLEPDGDWKAPRPWRKRDWWPEGRIWWDKMEIVPDRNGTNYAEHYASGKVKRAELGLVDWMKEYVGYDPDGDDWPGYQPGGVFAASREAIQRYPVEFYARLRDQLSKSVESEECHYIERSWLVILSGLANYAPPVSLNGARNGDRSEEPDQAKSCR